jgi:thiamine phosphate synthase YjbQ (UPF0047 family)
VREPTLEKPIEHAMKSLTEYLTFTIASRRGFVNITPRVEELVVRSGVRDGLCLVNAMHITASSTAGARSGCS